MPRYQLFAARDGDTFTDISIQPNYEAAEHWAAKKILAAFNLPHLVDHDFDEIVAETDGIDLNVLPTDPVAEFLVDWLAAQAQIIDSLRKHFDGRFATGFRSYRGGILDLLLAVQSEQELGGV